MFLALRSVLILVCNSNSSLFGMQISFGPPQVDIVKKKQTTYSVQACLEVSRLLLL